MVRLSLPLRDPFDVDYEDTPLTTPGCDSTQLIYNNTHCVTYFHFCSDSNPCPSELPCIDRVCQCLPSKHQYITLAPSPVRMYTAGCNYEKPRVSSCSKYEYGVDGVCLLNYCSEEMPCYAGKCDLDLESCVNITAARKPLPAAVNQVIDFGDDPFGFQQTKFTLTPLMIVLMVAGGIVGLAIVGCLIRTTLLGITSSVSWASKGQRLADGDEKYENKDKDSFSNPSLDMKLPMAFSSEPRVDLIQTPTNFNGAHYVPPRPLTISSDPSPYSAPTPSPQTSTFAPIETCAIQSSHSGHSGQSQGSTETESSIEIEIEDIGDKEDMTTTDMGTDELQEGQVDRYSCVSRSGSQSSIKSIQSASSNPSQHPILHKKRSMQDLRSMAMAALTPSTPTSSVHILDVPPLPAELASTTSSPIIAPYSPGSIAQARSKHLRLDVNAASALPFTAGPGSGNTTPQSYYYTPSPTSPFSLPSPALLRSKSLANTPAGRKLPAGFASSPIARHTDRFD